MLYRNKWGKIVKNVDLLQVPMHKFCLSQSLKQNIQILQMSQRELIEHIENEVDLNPILLKKTPSIPGSEYNFSKPASLYEDLTQQAKCILNIEEQEIADYLFRNLSKEGFLSGIEITEEILPVLKKVQKLEPPGICAKNLKDSLLIQLRRNNKANSLAYNIIMQYYDDLIQKKWKKIASHFQITTSKISEIIKTDLSKLSLRPAELYSHEKTFYPPPDIYIYKKEDTLQLKLNQSLFPLISINEKQYFCSDYLKKFYAKKAQTFIENLYKREHLLINIGKYLIKKEKGFFLFNTEIKALSVTDLAKFCNVHESTIHRCIKSKYILCFNSILPLKIFFKGQKVSETYLLTSLKKILKKENKNKPFSDLQLMSELKKTSINISRRTVTKYRQKLKIPTAKFRKEF